MNSRLTMPLFVIIIWNYSCNRNKVSKPKNLEEGILFFQQTWTATKLDSFNSKDEETAVAEVHFGAAMWVRNEWVHGDRNTKFRNYFNKLGIYHPDDISSLLFTSLHRRLNGKDIQLNKQVSSIKEFWKAVENCQRDLELIAKNNYYKYNVKDTINIYMPIDTTNNQRNAITFDCPTNNWKFNVLKDLKISAVILKKYYINKEVNAFFKIKIIKMNFPNTQILSNTVHIGSEIDMNLSGLNIE